MRHVQDEVVNKLDVYSNLIYKVHIINIIECIEITKSTDYLIMILTNCEIDETSPSHGKCGN